MVKNFQSGLIFGIVLSSICCCGSAIGRIPLHPTAPQTSHVDISACNLPAETGPCRALFPRHYYNLVTGQCNVFTYGGCLGNANNFVSSKECQAFGRKCLRDYKEPKTVRSRRYRSVGNKRRFPRSVWKS